ncbi:MAG: ribosome-associated translation inhibitor RaiA [Bacillota bacterium]|nr:MAG: ribosome-associated translation inhibitor RaiA [Bacillota bacterium]
MNIEIIERNYVASEHLRRIVEQKLEKLDKYFDGADTKCRVYFKKENISLKTEVMLEYQGKIIRAQEISDNFYENIDKILPKIEGQIRKYRTKFDKAQKNNAFKEQRVYDVEEIPSSAKERGIVKEKHFKLKPMLVEEAAEEMDMLGHSFFVFFDLKTQSVKVLYQRSDGNLGLIDPEI